MARDAEGGKVLVGVFAAVSQLDHVIDLEVGRQEDAAVRATVPLAERDLDPVRGGERALGRLLLLDGQGLAVRVVVPERERSVGLLAQPVLAALEGFSGALGTLAHQPEEVLLDVALDIRKEDFF